MVEFSNATLGKDGSLSVTKVRRIRQSSILACPHFMMVAEHYRSDESCRCDDPDHLEMAEWGYEWDGSVWAATEESLDAIGILEEGK